jgi:hypothetical protein
MEEAESNKKMSVLPKQAGSALQAPLQALFFRFLGVRVLLCRTLEGFRIYTSHPLNLNPSW